jgi:hypothetical protein
MAHTTYIATIWWKREETHPRALMVVLDSVQRHQHAVNGGIEKLHVTGMR